jgi:hypothetical protein
MRYSPILLLAVEEHFYIGLADYYFSSRDVRPTARIPSGVFRGYSPP